MEMTAAKVQCLASKILYTGLLEFVTCPTDSGIGPLPDAVSSVTPPKCESDGAEYCLRTSFWDICWESA